MRSTHNVIVIGAGSAGLTAAAGCARLGLRTALIERGRMGGDCLNTGCVPSKTLLAVARYARAGREAGGPDAEPPAIGWATVRARLDAAVAAIAPHDSEARFRDWGVEVIRGEARFVGPRSVAVGDRVLRAPRLVIAVGSRPRLPAIDGLSSVPFLTNETLFELAGLPRHLLVLGGGGIGVEMAQAFRRLGAQVTLVEQDRPLAREDPEAAALLLRRLVREGVEIRAGTAVVAASAAGAGVRLTLADGSVAEGSHLLVATGRVADVAALDLAAAGVRTGPGGIAVDAGRRSSNPHVLALGDCREGPRLTHAAAEDGAVAVMRIALGLPARVRPATLSWVTYTEPELAQVGLTETAARRLYRRVRVVRQRVAENDRAVCEGETEGFAKLVLAGGRPVGVTLVGAGAGELVLPWVMLLSRRTSLWGLSGAVVPYPTLSELSKALAFSAYEERVFGPWTRRWARLVTALRR